MAIILYSSVLTCSLYLNAGTCRPSAFGCSRKALHYHQSPPVRVSPGVKRKVSHFNMSSRVYCTLRVRLRNPTSRGMDDSVLMNLNQVYELMKQQVGGIFSRPYLCNNNNYNNNNNNNNNKNILSTSSNKAYTLIYPSLYARHEALYHHHMRRGPDSHAV